MNITQRCKYLIAASIMLTGLLFCSCTILSTDDAGNNPNNDMANTDIKNGGMNDDVNELITKSLSDICLCVNDLPWGWNEYAINANNNEDTYTRQFRIHYGNTKAKEIIKCTVYRYDTVEEAMQEYANNVPVNAIALGVADESCYYTSGKTLRETLTRKANIVIKIRLEAYLLPQATTDIVPFTSRVANRINNNKQD